MRVKPGILACIAVFGAICAVLGSVGLIVFPSLMEKTVQKSVALVNGSQVIDLWAQPRFAIFVEFYVFNITNALDVYWRGATPELQELGPYTYREYQAKKDISWSDNETQVSYRNYKYYVFDANRSVGSEHDLVVVPNIPYFGLLNFFKKNDLMRLKSDLSMLFTAVTAQSPFLLGGVKVGELIFSGYQDGLMSIVRTAASIIDKIPFFSEEIRNIVRHILENMPERIGIFYGKNDTFDGAYLIDTGRADSSLLGRILKWKDEEQLSWWATAQANMINGTDGTVFAPLIRKDQTLELFAADICRSLYVKFEKSVAVKGIPAYRFKIPSEVFDAFQPANIGFCADQGDANYFSEPCSLEPWWKELVHVGNHCLPSGFLDAEGCQKAPIAYSSPHFLYSPSCARVAVGWPAEQPNDTDYHTFLDIEPLSGAGVQFSRKLQINVKMFSDPNIPSLKYLRPVLMPLLWLHEHSIVDDATASHLYHQLVVVPQVANGVCIALIVVGGVLLLVLLGALLTALLEKNLDSTAADEVEREPLLDDSMSG